jgi:ComF family protein
VTSTRLLGRFGARLLDALGPSLCAGCDAPCGPDTAYCEACLALVGEACRAPSALGLEVFAGGPYQGPTRRAVKALKYAGRSDLARRLGRWLADRWPTVTRAGDMLVPVPLGPRRLVGRGYNQAALLARGLASVTGRRLVTGMLTRSIDTLPQAKLEGRYRRSNVEGVFTCHAWLPANVWLVDDVVTTGATARACQAAIEAQGGIIRGMLCLALASDAERDDDDAQMI